jgi:ATP-binding cassette, subfamily C, bacteriocin exporter
VFRRIPRIRQRDASDCGAACLASIAAWHGMRLPVARVRQFAHTDTHGTTALGLVRAATRLGFAAKGVRATGEALPMIPLPAIAHVIRGSLQHWVVLSRVSARRVELMDPASGKRYRADRVEFTREWSGVLVLLTPAAHFARGDGRTPVLRRFVALVAPHRGILAMATLGAAVHTALGLTMTVYVQQLVDHVLVDGNRNLLALMSVTMITLILVQAFIGGTKALLVLHTGQRMDASLILGYHRHLLSLPQRFFDTMRIGDITSRVGDAVKIRALINDVALELVVSMLVVTLSLALLFVYSAILGALVLGAIPVYVLLWIVANARNRCIARDLMERGAELQSQLVETVSSIGTIKRFGVEEDMERRTEVRFVRLLRAVYRAAYTAVVMTTAAGLVSRLSVVTLLWVGSVLVIDRRLTPGELMSCYALLGYLTAPLTTLINANRTIQDALIAADRLFEIMDLDHGRIPVTAVVGTGNAGDIELEQVSFGYGARGPALRNVTLRFAPGAVTAVIGESGSGKSTIAALIQRVYLPDEGRVRIGGIDVRYLSEDAIRTLVCAVPQRIDLLAATVLHNIALGDAEPDVARALDAARAAGIADVIDRLPDGFDTELTENGGALSGGERQRLAIARALYRDPQILILDEATSSLDATSVGRIRHLVHERRARGRAVIVIAHELDMVVDADLIVVLREGVVIQQGTHADLVSRSGAYRSMWESLRVDRVA